MHGKITCPDCGKKAWFAQVGRANGGSYRCGNCGNIEQGLACVECGCQSFYRSMPYGRITKCRSCGCSKEPAFG